jgi:hypothetical protein
VAPTCETVYSIIWAYGLHRHNYWFVCVHLLGYLVPLGCYRLSGWSRLIYLHLARLEYETESEKRLIQRLL